jgi:hypothetical protein
MLMLDTQTDLDTWHHTRVKDIMFQIGGGVLLHVVSKSYLIICIQVFVM